MLQLGAERCMPSGDDKQTWIIHSQGSELLQTSKILSSFKLYTESGGNVNYATPWVTPTFIAFQNSHDKSQGHIQVLCEKTFSFTIIRILRHLHEQSKEQTDVSHLMNISKPRYTTLPYWHTCTSTGTKYFILLSNNRQCICHMPIPNLNKGVFYYRYLLY